MSRKTYETSFWKERISLARKRGSIHYSVYAIIPYKWSRIAREHLKTIRRVVRGNVLDAGCGYGRMAKHINQYTGADFSQDFIEIAKKKYPKKRFIQCDLKDTPFKDKEFDWTICISIKGMVIANSGEDEWLKMLKELKRVSEKVLVLEYTNPDEYEIL